MVAQIGRSPAIRDLTLVALQNAIAAKRGNLLAGAAGHFLCAREIMEPVVRTRLNQSSQKDLRSAPSHGRLAFPVR